jgi:hypothetical protein
MYATYRPTALYLTLLALASCAAGGKDVTRLTCCALLASQFLASQSPAAAAYPLTARLGFAQQAKDS